MLFKDGLVGDLGVLYYLKPLLESNIIGFARSRFHFCTDCYQQLIKDHHLHEKMEIVKQYLRERCFKEVKFYFNICDEVPEISIYGQIWLVTVAFL